MDPQDSHVVFFQDDFMSSSYGHFDELREAKEFVDVTIVIRNRCFVGHKVVLAAAIPFLRLVLSGNEGGRVNLMLDELDPDEFESFMKFAYSGKITITSQNVQSLYFASKKLGLHRVHDVCYEFLVKGLKPNNAWKIHKFSKNCGNSQLTEAVDHYIRRNFEAFSKTEHFLDLPFSYLKEVLSSDDVRIAKEEIYFEAVIRWVKASLSERRNRLRDLLTQVRMSHLAPDYLVERVSSEDLVRNSAHCRELVDEAKNYILLSDKRLDVCSLETRPGIYERYETCTVDTIDYGLDGEPMARVPEVARMKIWLARQRFTEPLNEEKRFIHELRRKTELGGCKKKGSSMSSEEKLQLLKELTSSREKLQLLKELKKQGNDLYNGKKYKEASEKYTEVLNRLGSLLFRKKPSENICLELEEIKTSLLLNISLCKLKEKDYYSVIGYTTSVLERDPDNVKALYRRAKAHAGIWNFEESESDYRRILKLDSTLTSVIHKELKNIKTIQMQKKALGN